MTGLWIDPGRVEVVSGSCFRGSFRLQKWAEIDVSDEADAPSAIASVFASGRLSQAHVAVVVSSDLLTTRLLRLPTRSTREIEAMIPHQLGQELPVDLRDVTWNATAVDEFDDGSSLVRVEILRKDQLDACLAPVRRTGACVWSAIPEGEVFARRIARAIPARHERAFLVEHGPALHFVLEREGTLLFHRRLMRVEPAELRDLVDELRRRLGRELPNPVPLLANDDGKALAARLSEGTTLRVLPVVPPQEEGHAPFATAVAELAATRGAGLLPPETKRQLANAALRRALLRTALAGVAGATILALFLAATLYRTGRRVELLRAEVVAAQSRVDEVDQMRSRLDELAAPNADTELLRVIASLQESLAPELRVQTFRYTRARGGQVTFVGTSPSLGLVDDLEERLEGGTIWKSVTILRVQGRSASGEGYQFEVRGALQRASSNSGEGGR